MRSLFPESASDPSFEDLSEPVKETLRAMWKIHGL